MIEIDIRRVDKVAVKYLRAEVGVRYWEDGTVNGVEGSEGSLIPFRDGDTWRPVIDLETGVVQGWPSPATASVHYKVCDAGRYALLDADRNVVVSIGGYVPPIMSPGGDGYGDYVIMEIDSAGKIANWRANLDGFTRPSDDD